MSTTESGPRTTESESTDPPDEKYTGRWSDWIDAEPTPRPVRVEDYDDEYLGYDEDFDDEPYYEPEPGRAAPRRPLTTHHAPARRGFADFSLGEGMRRWAVPLLGLLAVLAVTAAIAVQIAKVSSSTDAHAAPGVATPPPAQATAVPQPTQATDQQAAGTPADLCPNETRGDTVRGNGPGSTKTGPDVILALQNRYYVDRSGKSVREMFAPDASVPSVEQIQAGIDSIPRGTTYCVQIMPGPFDGQHIMVVTEQHPDASKHTWPPQLVMTTKVGDTTLVSAIVPMTSDTPK
ncbi:hypothetical protein [Nocardia sp. NBC_00511]|uniref:hypothetical protein n=1 Tax=Nocardia sp. NBC_00511 TaxID=2903591 RepID=UPI0030E0E2D1